MPEETVTIEKSRYNDLVQRSNRLMALEAAGVDNWQGYNHAMEILHGEDED